MATRIATISVLPTGETPLLASLPGIVGPEDVDYQYYHNTNNRKSHQRLLAGETDRVEYTGANFGDVPNLYKFAIGIYDAKKGVVRVRGATLYNIQRQVKSLKNAETIKSRVTEYRAARNLLGETFGTRKKQQEIRALERNQVDVTGIRDAELTIRDAISSKAENMLTQEEVMKESELDRAIPPYDVEATEPAKIYKIEDLIPLSQHVAIHFKHLLQVKKKDVPDLRKQGIYSDYVLSHIEGLCDHPNKKHVREHLKLLVYLSYMIRFHFAHERDLNDESGQSKPLKGIPEAVRERLLADFAEQQQDIGSGKIKFSIPSKKKDRLVAYILAICLHIDNFSLDPEVIAADLKMTPSKIIEFCRTLGCSIAGAVNRKRKLDDEEAEEEAAAAEEPAEKKRRAVLTAPVKFPKPKLGIRK